MSSTKPNLFIVGSPKCGTSSLYEFFKDSKDIVTPHIKELNFWSAESLDETSHYYNYYAVRTMSDYLDEFTKSAKYAVDGSVSYLIVDGMAERLHKFEPSSKIIICYRNPIERLISHFKMDYRMGLVEGELSKYLYDEQSAFYQQYVSNSLFFKYSHRYIDAFGRNNVLFVDVSNLNVKAIAEFLELRFTTDMIKVSNPARELRIDLLHRIISNRRMVEKMGQYVPSIVRKLFQRIVYTSKRGSEWHIEVPENIKKLIMDDWEKFQNLKKKSR
jgi:hypothetical protein